MEFFKSSNASFGVSSSINRAAPREPGSAYAAQLNSYEARLFTATASPPREVKAKVSFGGGFYLPKRESGEQHSQESDISAKFNWRPDDVPEEPRVHGQGIIDSLEVELMRLKRESYSIKEQKASKPVQESLLHLNPTPHRHVQEKRPEDMSLADLETMRSRHAAKLVELEAEYLMQKKDLNRQSRAAPPEDKFSKTLWMSHDQEETKHEYVERPHLPPKQTFISKYEAKFERYLNEKVKQKRGREIKGTAVWEPTPQEAEDNKNELKILVKYMFNKLDKDLSGQVDRLELLQEIHSNPELAELFNLKSLVTDDSYVVKFNEMYKRVAGDRDSITLPELNQFFHLDRLEQTRPKPISKAQTSLQTLPNKPQVKPQTLPKQSYSIDSRSRLSNTLSPRKETETSTNRDSGTVCLLQAKHISILDSLFNYADEHQDFVMSRRKLYDTYYQDERVIKILGVDAVRLSANQSLSLESMLEFILQDGDGMDELITWKQFLDYFYTRPVLIESNKGPVDPRLEDYDIPKNYMQIIQDLFDSTPRHTRDKVSTYKFLTTLRRDPQVKGFLSMRARETHKLSDIPGESLNELLDRIEEEADALITWHEVLGYFSRRGKPSIEQLNELRKKEPTVELRSPTKPVREAFVQTIEEPMPPPSAPRPKVSKKKTAKGLRLNKSFDHLDYLGSERISYRDQEVRSLTPRGTKFNITIPQPFGFDQREMSKKKSIRQQKVEEMVQEKELELQRHINFKYKARAVPAEVVIPRYEGIKATQEARRFEVKRTSKDRTRSQERPFNFYTRDLNKEKAKPPSPPKYEFKANPIPWEVSVPLYEKLVNEDKAARDERIARAAQEALRKAKLPPRMEMHEHTKSQQGTSAKPLSQSSSFKAKDPPDFAKLQRKFQTTLEAKKESRKPTESKPFNFTEIVRKVKPIPEVAPWEKLKTASKSKSISQLAKTAEPVVMKTTVKMQDMLKKRQEQKAAEEAKKQAVEKADEDRKLRLEAMKPRVQSSQVIVEKSRSLKDTRDNAVRAAKQKFKEQDEDYAKRKEEMMARISNRPLLVEQATSQVSKHNSRLKTLLKVKQSLVQEGVNPNTYFNEDEKDLIEDAEYLVKVGRLPT